MMHRTVVCLLVLVPLLGDLSGIRAETFVVTKTEDDDGPCTPDDCSFREAVLAANATTTGDVIELPPGVHSLTIPRVGEERTQFLPESGDLDIRAPLTIRGDPAGGTVITSQPDFRAIEIGFTTARFFNVTISGSRETTDDGGCVRMIEGVVTFTDSTITNCYSRFAGGGLAVLASAATFLNTTISNNTSEYKGGGFIQFGLEPSHSIELVNTTVSGNHAADGGGGFYRSNGGEASIKHSTFSLNTAPFGDAVFNDFPRRRTFISNSIIHGKCRGLSLTTRGGNLGGPDLVDHCFQFSLVPSDRAATDLGLAPLDDYGGPTRTHALLPGSPAIDGAEADDCEATDQRGESRPVGPGCDSGAFEGILDVTNVPVLDARGLGILAVLLAVAASFLLRRRSRI